MDSDKVADFEALGHKVAYEAQDGPRAGDGGHRLHPRRKREQEGLREDRRDPKGFLAQGSEFGFGKPYAMGINDEALVPGEDRFLQIVSCNTHNIACLIKTLGTDGSARGL